MTTAPDPGLAAAPKFPVTTLPPAAAPAPAVAVPQIVHPTGPVATLGPPLFIGAGLLLGAVAFVIWRRSQRVDPSDVLRALRSAAPPVNGDDIVAPPAVEVEVEAAHMEFPPVDLHRPIHGEAAWRAIRMHAADPAYLMAVEAVRRRFAELHPLTLSDVLRETMAEGKIGFRAAMLQIGGQARPTSVVEDGQGPFMPDPAPPDRMTPRPEPRPPGSGAT